jgi:acyl-CoA thioester hydrolase
MSRIKLEIPTTFSFRTHLKVRVDDLNYGNHLSNDSYLKYMHEARFQFFSHLGLSEMNIGGCSVIMGDNAIQFKQECFYGEELRIEVVVDDIGKKSFDMYYRFTKVKDASLVCIAKTGMVCFNYETHQTAYVPESFIKLTRPQEG